MRENISNRIACQCGPHRYWNMFYLHQEERKQVLWRYRLKVWHHWNHNKHHNKRDLCFLWSALYAQGEDRDKLIAVSSCKVQQEERLKNNHLNLYHFLQDGLNGAAAYTWDQMSDHNLHWIVGKKSFFCFSKAATTCAILPLFSESLCTKLLAVVKSTPLVCRVTIWSQGLWSNTAFGAITWGERWSRGIVDSSIL